MRCELCRSDRRDSIQYGEFLTKNGKGVHTNCLYLSSGLQQNGSDNEGLMGFLLEDIAIERQRVSTVQCHYCRKMSANIGCCEKRCYRAFHLICGVKHGAMNQFLDTFRSFCDRHVRKVRFRPKYNEVCYICYEKIYNEGERFRAVKMIQSPCCRNGWFHKYCLQKFAKSAGYFFKCPLCNDCENFKVNMSYWGIFVQDKDAEWELVPNAYAELLERPNECIAKICHNAQGRGQSNDTNPFIYCATCGSVAMHRSCTTSLRDSSFECDNCHQILNGDSGRESLTVVVDDDENSDVDVCADTEEEMTGESQEEEDSDEVILRPNIKKRNTLYTLNDNAESSSSEDEDEDVIVMESKHRIAANKRDIIEASTGGSESNSVILKCSNEQKLCVCDNETDCSEDEGLPNTFEDQQKTRTTNGCDTKNSRAGPVTRSNMRRHEEPATNPINISCIAQRTRRKSITGRPPLINYKEATTDDENSTNVSQSSVNLQAHQYNDVHVWGNTTQIETNEDGVNSEESTKIDGTRNTQSEFNSETESAIEVDVKVKEYSKVGTTSNKQSGADSDTESAFEVRINSTEYNRLSNISYMESKVEELSDDETNSGQGVLSYFYALLHEVKNGKNVEQADREDEKVDDIVVERQNNNSDHQRRLNEKETQNIVKNEAANSLDVSCIANRTRRRSSAYMQRISQRKLSTDSSAFTYEDIASKDSLNISCIAKRTRRSLANPDDIKANKEDDLEEENSKPTRRKTISFAPILIDNIAQNSTQSVLNNTNDSTTTSTTESFKSSTYFGRSLEHAYENNIASNCDEENAQTVANPTQSTHWNHASTSKDNVVANQSDQLTQKRKGEFDTPMPTKIPATTTEAYEPEDHNNVLELSCIASRTRRKSVDAKTFLQLVSLEEDGMDNERVSTSKISAPTTTDDSEAESKANILELSCIANRTRRKSLNQNKCKEIPSIEETDETHATDSEPASHIFTTWVIDSSAASTSSDVISITTQYAKSSASSAISTDNRRGQRTRIRPHRFLNSENESNSGSSSIVHSPMPRIANWSNLKENNDAYFMPKYRRVNGKAKRDFHAHRVEGFC